MAVRTRNEIHPKDKWKIEDLYETDELWEKDFEKAVRAVEGRSPYQGKIADGPESLANVLKESDATEYLVERLYVYANMKYYEDMGNAVYKALAGRAHNLMTDFGEKYAFIEPEILALDEETIEQYLQSGQLKPYLQYVKNIIRQRAHILSADMEAVLAKASRMAQAAGDIFGSFNNADIRFGDITDENGQAVELTQGRYAHFMENRNQSVRKEAYDKLYQAYGAYANTLASCYNANVTQAVFFARERHYDNTLQACLDSSNIPVEVYDNLITAVNGHIDLMHRYVSLRKRALGLLELHMYDVYAPLVEDFDMKVTFEEAKETMAKALSPLGKDYVEILKEGYENGWIDAYENQGKRSGAFSWGAYGTHPYVFMNYQENLNSMFTLAHEMGHAIHTFKSNEKQPHMYAGYRIFVAEVASTCNEALLIRYLIRQSKDIKEKAYLINHFLEQFKGTMFRQTMFAEFERQTHKLAEEGEILTAQLLNKIYYELNEKYFGSEMVLDENIALEWARIPHFYTPFYVYQYATGFAAAVAISQRILDMGEPAVEGYMEFLSSGSSDYPIEVLKKAGVNMEDPSALEGAFVVFSQLLDEFEAALDIM